MDEGSTPAHRRRQAERKRAVRRPARPEVPSTARSPARPRRRRLLPKQDAAQRRPPGRGCPARGSSSSSSPASRFPPTAHLQQGFAARVTTQELWHVPEASQGLDPLLGLSLGPCLLVRAAYPPVITEETGSRLGHGRQEPLTERRVDDLDDLAHRLPALPVQGNDALGVFPRRGAVVEAPGGYLLPEKALGSQRDRKSIRLKSSKLGIL